MVEKQQQEQATPHRVMAADSATNAIRGLERMHKALRMGVSLPAESLQSRLQPAVGPTTLYRCARTATLAPHNYPFAWPLILPASHLQRSKHTSTLSSTPLLRLTQVPRVGRARRQRAAHRRPGRDVRPQAGRAQVCARARAGAAAAARRQSGRSGVGTRC